MYFYVCVCLCECFANWEDGCVSRYVHLANRANVSDCECCPRCYHVSRWDAMWGDSLSPIFRPCSGKRGNLYFRSLRPTLLLANNVDVSSGNVSKTFLTFAASRVSPCLLDSTSLANFRQISQLNILIYNNKTYILYIINLLLTTTTSSPPSSLSD